LFNDSPFIFFNPYVFIFYFIVFCLNIALKCLILFVVVVVIRDILEHKMFWKNLGTKNQLLKIYYIFLSKHKNKQFYTSYYIYIISDVLNSKTIMKKYVK